ncbi:MAG: DUF2786 domain-containing protein [Acidimicrobiales bacterium]
MGKNSKARRAARAKSRAQRGNGPSSWGTNENPGSRRPPWTGDDDGSRFTETEDARGLLWLTAQARHRRDGFAPNGLSRLARMAPDVVDRAAEAVLLDEVSSVWIRGWQPSELHRRARLGSPTAAVARLVHLAMATDHVGRRSVTLDQRWISQIEGLDLPAVNGREGWVGRWLHLEGLDRTTAVAGMVDALAGLMQLPTLDPLLPLPGSAGSRPRAAPSSRPVGDAGAETNPILDRIRALLAMAESTTFEAEATAFTAKAQALMTRHAIDAALLQGRTGQNNEHPVTIRVPIDAPYADAKSFLLQTVARAGRCRSVFDPDLSWSSVVGFAGDLAGVELLFTSLLLQAQTALTDAAKRAPAGTRTRSRQYRSAFLVAYAGRIGDRLSEINEAVFAEVEAEHGSAFLPVLHSRSAEVDDVVAERFGELTNSRVRGGYDPAGWAEGRSAADRARLNFGELVGEPTP